MKFARDFKKGRWYLGQGYYFKVIDVTIKLFQNRSPLNSSSYMITCEMMHPTSKKWHKIDTICNNVISEDALTRGPLTDLSAIYKHLPEGHIDKLPTTYEIC